MKPGESKPKESKPGEQKPGEQKPVSRNPRIRQANQATRSRCRAEVPTDGRTAVSAHAGQPVCPRCRDNLNNPSLRKTSSPRNNSLSRSSRPKGVKS